jgi:hypothetical protein
MIVSILWLFKNYHLFDVEKKGILVEMRIIDKPQVCVGTQAKYNMKVQYNGRVFIKQIASSVCESYHIGDLIKMKYLEGDDQILYPQENVSLDFIAALIIALLAGILVIYSFK